MGLGRRWSDVLTVFGIVSATSMVVSYAAEHRHPNWIAVFAISCVATAMYGVATDSWLFATLEFIWAAIAVKRFRDVRLQR